MPRGTLGVILVSAKDLKGNDFLKKMDPYVILTYRAKKHTSSVANVTKLLCAVSAGFNPRWNESFLFTVSDNVSELNLRMMDKDIFNEDDYLGVTRIPLEQVFVEGSIRETSYSVVKNLDYCREVKVALTFNPEW